MPHFLAAIADDGTVTVAADVAADFKATQPWAVVDAAGLAANSPSGALTHMKRCV